MSTATTTENKTVPTKRPVPEDMTYMGYYRLDNHDAQCLQVGDRLARNGRLVTVTDVSRKRHPKFGLICTTTLSDGFSFDPVFDERENNEPWLLSMTFYRPRRAFSAAPILPRGKKSEHGLDTLKKDHTKKGRGDRKTSGSRK